MNRQVSVVGREYRSRSQLRLSGGHTGSSCGPCAVESRRQRASSALREDRRKHSRCRMAVLPNLRPLHSRNGGTVRWPRTANRNISPNACCIVPRAAAEIPKKAGLDVAGSSKSLPIGGMLLTPVFEFVFLDPIPGR